MIYIVRAQLVDGAGNRVDIDPATDRPWTVEDLADFIARMDTKEAEQQ